MKEWVTGDIINATDMNRIESSALPVVTFTVDESENITCDTAFEDAAKINGDCITVIKTGKRQDYKNITTVTVNLEDTGDYVTFTSYSFNLNTGEMTVNVSKINLYEDGHVTGDEKVATVTTK